MQNKQCKKISRKTSNYFTSITECILQKLGILCDHELIRFGISLLLAVAAGLRQVVVDTLVVVIHSHGQHLLSLILADHVTVQVFKYLEKNKQDTI